MYLCMYSKEAIIICTVSPLYSDTLYNSKILYNVISCVVSLSKNINPSLVLVKPRKTRPYITERLLMGRKESNQTNKQNNVISIFTKYQFSLN